MNCYCGHAEDEHGGSEKYPGATACTLDQCPCIAFDEDEETNPSATRAKETTE